MKSPENEQLYTLNACNWELTLRCTLRCIHCGSTAGKKRDNELTLPECMNVAGELVRMGCRELTFIGGEVFLFKGWDRLASYLIDEGVIVNMVSNGYKIREDDIRRLKEIGLENIGISIDGMEKNHNYIRGRDDAFDEIRKTLAMLRKHEVSCGVVTSLIQRNVRDLERMYGFLVGQGVSVWQLQLVNPMGSMLHSDEKMINTKKIRKITSFIREKNKDRTMVVIAADSIGYFDENEVYIRGTRSPLCYWTGCQAGTASIFIDSVGNVKGCGSLYSDVFIEGNVRSSTLQAIWNDPSAFAYNRHYTPDLLEGKCGTCDMSDVCKGGCRSSNYFNTGSLYKNVYCSYS